MAELVQHKGKRKLVRNPTPPILPVGEKIHTLKGRDCPTLYLEFSIATPLWYCRGKKKKKGIKNLRSSKRPFNFEVNVLVEK